MCRNGCGMRKSWQAGVALAVCAQSPKGIALQPNNQAAHCDEVMGQTAPNCRTRLRAPGSQALPGSQKIP